MATLVCPVRGCGAALPWARPALRCPRGHTFDVARSGYVNLLLAQDRRAREPGDSAEAVRARRRSLDRGLGAALLETLAERLGPEVRPGDAVLDVGCGEGTFLAALAARLGLEGWGLDISTPAIDAAARRHPGVRWIVGNADRVLPFADAGFAAVLSITARKPGTELARVLRPGGVAIVAVPASDDLAELRAAVLGQAIPRDRTERTAELLGTGLALEARAAARHRAVLDPAALADLLAGSYRGARHRERERVTGLAALEVTISHDVLVFRKPR